MILTALAAVDETSPAYSIGFWLGRLAVILLVVLLLAKLVRKGSSGRSGGRRPPAPPAMSTPLARDESLAYAPAVGSQTILPLHPGKRRRGK